MSRYWKGGANYCGRPWNLRYGMVARMTPYGLVYFEDPWMVVDVHANHADEWISWITVAEVFSYGTYQWKGKFLNVGTNKRLWMGFEYRHGRADNGIIAFRHIGSGYRVSTSWNGSMTHEDLTGQDWTSETEFKIVWTSSKVEFYVDGVLKATITTNIPQAPMGFFAEVGTLSTAPTTDSKIYVKDFEVL